MSAIIRIDSPLITRVQHGLLGAIRNYTGLSLDEILDSIEWREFYGRILADEYKESVAKFPTKHGYDLAFKWIAAQWKLIVSNAEDMTTLHRSRIYHGTTRTKLLEEVCVPVVAYESPDMKNHRQVDGSELFIGLGDHKVPAA